MVGLHDAIGKHWYTNVECSQPEVNGITRDLELATRHLMYAVIHMELCFVLVYLYHSSGFWLSLVSVISLMSTICSLYNLMPSMDVIACIEFNVKSIFKTVFAI